MNGFAGMSFLISVVAIVFGVFLSCVSVVALVKVLQIAEDLRYMRSRSDVNVQRPKPYQDTLKKCLLVAVIVAVVVLFLVFYSAAAFNVGKLK